MGNYTREDFERYRKEQDEKAAKVEEERRERTEREAARQAWIRDGGSAADFKTEWPAIRDEGRRQRVLNADQKERENQRAAGVSRI